MRTDDRLEDNARRQIDPRGFAPGCEPRLASLPWHELIALISERPHPHHEDVVAGALRCNHATNSTLARDAIARYAVHARGHLGAVRQRHCKRIGVLEAANSRAHVARVLLKRLRHLPRASNGPPSCGVRSGCSHSAGSVRSRSLHGARPLSRTSSDRTRCRVAARRSSIPPRPIAASRSPNHAPTRTAAAESGARLNGRRNGRRGPRFARLRACRRWRFAASFQLLTYPVGHEGLEPSANGLRVHCSTN